MPRGLKLEATPRNDFEVTLSVQLAAAGIEFDYEPHRIPVSIPAREAAYIPDFIPRGSNIVIEGKGVFGGGRSMATSGAAARQKMLLVKAQHPELDIRFVFQNARTRIYKGSKTTYAKWAEDHGFKWAHKVIPQEWLEEIRMQQGSKRREQTNKRNERNVSQSASARRSRVSARGSRDRSARRPRVVWGNAPLRACTRNRKRRV